MKKFILKNVLPPNSSRRKLAIKLKQKLKTAPGQPKAEITYAQWITDIEPSLWGQQPKFKELISIIVPCYNTPKNYLDELLSSVSAQTYTNWQLCLIDGSTDSERSAYIAECAEGEARITYQKIGKNLGIVGNTNIGLQAAKGKFVAFMDHDDTLAEHALEEVAIVLGNHPKTDLVYSDEDKLSDDGTQRQLPFFKPDWSPELLLGVNYITHFVVARKSLIDTIGGLRAGFDGAQDYDFLLRLTEKTSRIVHVPKILYHWRLAEGSTAKNVGEKNYADTAGQRALRDAVKRRGIKADVVEIPERPTNYRLKFKLPSPHPKVSIIIPFKDKVDLTKQCVDSILEKTTYKNYELILVSNNSIEPATHKYLKTLQNEKRCKQFIWDHPFNFSKVNNYGRKQASGDYLVLLNNDTEVITPTWLDELVGVASQPGIGLVGPLLWYPNKTIQHAGVIVGLMTMAGHVFRYRQLSDWTDFGMPAWPRNYLAITGACIVVKASTYDEVGGLDEVFTVAGQDVAFGISLYEKGYRNVYWPFAELVHHENVTVGSYDTGIQLDYDHSLKYYRPYLNWHDPYFNRNLDLMNEQVGLRSVYE